MAIDNETELKLKITTDKSSLTALNNDIKKSIDDIGKSTKQFTNEFSKVGKNMNIGEIGSKKYWIEFRKGYTDLMNSVSQSNPKWSDYKAKVDLANTSLKQFSTTKKMSTAQMLEFGENLTVIAAGIGIVASQVKKYVSELYNLAKAGAEFGVLKQSFDELNGGTDEANQKLELFRTALAGNFNDRQIISFSNKMKELGYNTEQTAQVFDLSERASDKFDGSIEKANDTLLRFFETGKGKGLFQFGIDVGAVNTKMTELSGKTDEQIKKMTTEEQQLLRTQATLQLYGRTMADVSQKTQDNADKIRSLETTLENVKAAFGKTFSDEVIKSIESIGGGLKDLGLKMNDTNKQSKDLGGAFGTALGKILPFALGGWAGLIVGNLGKITGAFKGLMEIFKTWDPGVFNNIRAGISGFFTWVIDGVKEVLGWLKMIGFLPQQEAKTATSTFKVAVGGTLDTGETTDGKTKGSKNINEKDAIEQLDEIQQLEKDIEALRADKLSFIARYGQYAGIVLDTDKKILETEEKINYLRTGATKPKELSLDLGDSELQQIDKSLLFSDAELRQMQKIEEQGKQMTDALIEQSEIFRQSWAEVIGSVASGLGDLFGIMASGGDSGEAFKSFMKGIVGTFISSVQAMLLASNAALIAKGITTFGISLLTDAPLLAAGWLALEAAKGFIGALYTGGTLRPGEMALVGDDRGRITPQTELIYANSGTNVLSNRDLMQALSSTRGGSSNSPNVVVKVSGLLRDLVKVGIEQNNKREALLAY